MSRLWPLPILLCILPLLGIGLFGRGYWNPDEPREAAIAWSMARQEGKAVPELAGDLHCEKPPLLYWCSGGSLALFGQSAWAARLPLAAFALIGIFSIALIARRAAGPVAAAAAGIACGTMALNAQVSVWLATDAPLVAGVCLALLGLYRGLLAGPGRGKLGWYLLMHAGLLLGFFSKNLVAWLLPGLAFLALLAWERRWGELRRWELHLGWLLQAVAIVPWILAVAAHAQGADCLRIFFHDNLLGRFLPLPGVPYQAGHPNFPGKYLVELPFWTLPWTFLIAAGALRCWREGRDPAADPARRLAWRLCACVFLPWLLLLSLSATARGIYLAPAMPALGLLVGLWAAEGLLGSTRGDRRVWWATWGLVLAVVAAGAVGTGVFLAKLGVERQQAITVALVLAVVPGWFLVRAFRHRRSGRDLPASGYLVAGLTALAVMASMRLLPLLDAGLDLSRFARSALQVQERGPLVLWQPDETTLALLDYHAGLRPPRIQNESALADALLQRPDTVVMVQASRRGPDDVGLLVRNLSLVPIHGQEAILGRRYVFLQVAMRRLGDQPEDPAGPPP